MKRNLFIVELPGYKTEFIPLLYIIETYCYCSCIQLVVAEKLIPTRRRNKKSFTSSIVDEAGRHANRPRVHTRYSNRAGRPLHLHAVHARTTGAGTSKAIRTDVM